MSPPSYYEYYYNDEFDDNQFDDDQFDDDQFDDDLELVELYERLSQKK